MKVKGMGKDKGKGKVGELDVHELEVEETGKVEEMGKLRELEGERIGKGESEGMSREWKRDFLRIFFFF